MSNQPDTPLRPKLTDRQCRLFLKDAKEFGYPSLTFEEVRKIADQVADGTYKKTDVIAIMMKDQIDEAMELSRGRRR